MGHNNVKKKNKTVSGVGAEEEKDRSAAAVYTMPSNWALHPAVDPQQQMKRKPSAAVSKS